MFSYFYYNILNILFLCNSYFNKYSITFSNPKTQSLVGILELHDHLMFFILLIFNIKMCFFLYSIITSRKNLFFNEKKGPLKNDVFEFNERYVEEGVYSFKHATVLEFIWTILPGIVLVIMAVPSFMLLYSLEESNFPVFNICVIGNQWYWSYEYMDFDVLHYYSKFINNKFTFFRENIKEYRIFLDCFFLKINRHDVFNMMFDTSTLTGEYLDTFLNSAIAEVGNRNCSKVLSSYDLDLVFEPEDFIYVFNNMDENIDWSWILGSLDEDFPIDLAHNFYIKDIFNFDALKKIFIEDFYLDNLLLTLDEVPILFLSDAFLRTLEDKFEDTLTLDCQIVPESDLPLGYPRLLTTDQVLVIPSETPLRFLVTSNDVIHSWCIPSFGIKMDAIPGRLNQVLLTTPYFGTSWGQCSELCGVNHGFMPIEIRAIPYEDFSPYIKILIKSYTNSFASRYFSLNFLEIAYGDTVSL